MTTHIRENISTGLVDWSLVIIMGNTTPPRDPNDDDDEEEEEEEEEEEDEERTIGRQLSGNPNPTSSAHPL